MSGVLQWFKSSYSDDEGANCLEVAVERNESTSIGIHIRDSKDSSGPEIALSAAAWLAFIAAVQPGA
ncbi:DUF397 domain-containing protein [Streptomyces sp. Je 1-369]|uniref:DUF397 domain-containing protein n=1 Tax=Streptomyces sp. Je 1-369 TaxID=2966192 RepID=UPI00228601DC|nr:DUF397 domain-containing protein [Streptomyces sp. Je 1-369]WAL96841.1 DUF397 domain-containing protein [Streptomyces sp. Je 1-369]